MKNEAFWGKKRKSRFFLQNGFSTLAVFDSVENLWTNHCRPREKLPKSHFFDKNFSTFSTVVGWFTLFFLFYFNCAHWTDALTSSTLDAHIFVNLGFAVSTKFYGIDRTNIHTRTTSNAQIFVYHYLNPLKVFYQCITVGNFCQARFLN